MLCFIASAMILSGCEDNRKSQGMSSLILADGGNWPSGGRDYDEQHYSPLSEIDTSNVAKLGLVSSVNLDGEQSLEATPLAINGILYFSGSLSTVYAVDASNGTILWKYDPKVMERDPERLRYIFAVNRGVAYSDGKVFVGTIDGRLVALDDKTGKSVWEVLTIDRKSKRTITGAPRTYGDKVLIGNGGGDYGERGYITAYNVKTGKQAWRFYTAPGSPEENKGDATMEMAAKTWSGKYWKTGTGGTVWDSFTYDPELNRVYVGTGNSGPYNPAVRSPGNGDNLFLVSIVALDADTGKYIWHYQMNPREAWDFKATAGIQMAELMIGGKKRKVLMQSPTNGFFYVIDRNTGRLISAQKIGKVTWADRIDLKTGRPVEAPNIRYEDGAVTIWPGQWGAHNWQAMSFSPQTGLVYIPYQQVGTRYSIDKSAALGGTVMSAVVEGEGDGKGKLLAWDPVAQKARWSVPLESLWNGGTLATAGRLVFQGIEDGTFNAYDAETGHKVWSFNAGLGIIAAPISYKVSNKQYVSILVGYGGSASMGSSFIQGGWRYGEQPRRLLTFALNGAANLPKTAPRNAGLYPLDDPELTIDKMAAIRGKAITQAKNCILCHGMNLISRGSPGPDLRESNVALDRKSLGSLLKSGSLASNGMPAFPELTDENVSDLYMYIRARARESRDHPNAKLQATSSHF